MTALTHEQIQKTLAQLPGWTFEQDYLKKTFAFKSFPEAISFIVRLSFYAEEMDHHPELFNVYNKVDIALRTHDAGNKVTQKDIDLALAIESVSWV